LYTDDLFVLDPVRHVNNGQPSYHAMMIASAAVKPGEHVVHVGAGVDYYLVRPGGKITAIEFDEALAHRASKNFCQWPDVTVIQGNGAVVDFDAADVIYVTAGATYLPDRWLDSLKDGGRLIVPLTTDSSFMNDDAPERRGAVFHIQRNDHEFLARWIGPIAIIPCEGVRDALSDAALAAAFLRIAAGFVPRHAVLPAISRLSTGRGPR
jgi:protein-L-isoaspartate(D-aspartate) O-methyltransferase